ncbi:MAG: bacillithiol biosynthesis deacetylase BshB1 [bacterium]
MSVDVLAIGAHPDDVELGCGAILIKMRKLGYDVAIVELTEGEMGTGGTAEVRYEESMRAAEIIGATREMLSFGDCQVMDNYENRLKVAEIIRKYAPEIVFAPYWDGLIPGQGHPDHKATGHLVRHAVGYARLRKMPINFPPHTPKLLCHMMLPRNVIPDFVVDITDVFDVWMEAVKAHASQFLNPEKERDYIWAIETMARNYGSYIRTKYGQGFVVVEPISIRDPFVLVDGGSRPVPVREEEGDGKSLFVW